MIDNPLCFCYDSRNTADFFVRYFMINVCDIQIMKPLLAEHGFHLSKAKGQNFLIASWVPQQIAEDAGVDTSAGVLETPMKSPPSCR